MLIVPLQPVPSQSIKTVLNGQNCVIEVYQEILGLYLNLYLNTTSTLIIGGVLCEDANPIVRSKYLGFIGDLAFIDNSGAGQDPYYKGLGTQFSLSYL